MVSTAHGLIAQPTQNGVISAIKTASAKTGVDFSYLVNQAKAESALNPNAKASTSSATGLYQFINNTWLATIKEHGAEHGLSNYADAITVSGGKARVNDPDLRQEILDLRKDPKTASIMAAEFAADNKAYLEKKVDGDINSPDLYMAHFLGAGQASAFLNAKNDNPYQTAADLFPKAARANYNVFYDRQTGKPKTLGEVYSNFEKKFGTQHTNIAANNVSNKNSPSTITPLRSWNEAPSVEYLSKAQEAGFSTFGQKPSDNPLEALRSALPLTGNSLVMSPIEIMILANLPKSDVQSQSQNTDNNEQS